MYIDFKTVRSWELALSPRYEEGDSAIIFRSGAIYRVKIGERYELTFHRDLKGARIFTLYCEGEISEDEIIPLSADRGVYMKALSEFTRIGEDIDYEERNPDRGRVIFTGDYPSA